MNKKSLSFLILSGVSITPLVVSAQLHNYGSGTTVQNLVTSAELLGAFLFGAVAVFCFIMAGILFLTAQGSPEKVQTARASLYWGFAGVVVGIIAFSIIAIVENFMKI